MLLYGDRPYTWRSVGVSVLVTLLLVLPRPAAAAELDNAALLLLRALAFDKNLAARAGEEVVVAVLYRVGDARSERTATDMYAAFRKLEKARVAGRPFRAMRVPYDKRRIDQVAAADGVDAVFVTEGLEDVLGEIVGETRRLKLVSLSAHELHVQKGVSLGAVKRDGKPVLLVNLPASKREGADFSAKMLRFAILID